VAAVTVGGGILVLMLAAWRIRDALLLVVASAVVAVLLDTAAKPLREHTSLSRPWAVIAAGSAIGVVLALLGWLLAHQIQAQIASLASLLPQAVQSLEQRVGLSFLADQAGQSGSGWAKLLGEIVAVGTTILSAATSLILVVIAAFFLATNPATYRRGLIALFPKRRQ
jgi:predicted PurR-regulated permease PerM